MDDGGLSALHGGREGRGASSMALHEAIADLGLNFIHHTGRVRQEDGR